MKNKRFIVLILLCLLLSLTLSAVDASFLTRLSDEERSLLARQKPLTVLINPSWEPLEYINKQGELSGLSVAYLGEVSNLTGLEFVPVVTDSWQNAYGKLLSGEIAMTGSISKTERRVNPT